jgi:uncharacterized Ntn-hydrolase superfamily protein
MTYSILGYAPETDELGIAVQSKFPGVGGLVPHGASDVGGIVTQAFANPAHGPKALTLLRAGAEPEEVITILLREDAHGPERQIAILTPDGRRAAYTGSEVMGWDGAAGAAEGTHTLALGNSLASSAVLERMVEAFTTTAGELGERLVEALRAGRDAGGEIRGQQSAALAIWKTGGGYGGHGHRHVDIPVYDHPEPIEELARCYRLHRLAYFPSDPANLVPIEPERTAELKTLLQRRGYPVDPADPHWDAACIKALKRFMGEANYDNRLRDDAWIDREVLEDLRARYAGS